MFGVGVRLKQSPELSFWKKKKKSLDKNVRTYILHK